MTFIWNCGTHCLIKAKCVYHYQVTEIASTCWQFANTPHVISYTRLQQIAHMHTISGSNHHANLITKPTHAHEHTQTLTTQTKTAAAIRRACFSASIRVRYTQMYNVLHLNRWTHTLILYRHRGRCRVIATYTHKHRQCAHRFRLCWANVAASIRSLF